MSAAKEHRQCACGAVLPHKNLSGLCKACYNAARTAGTVTQQFDKSGRRCVECAVTEGVRMPSSLCHRCYERLQKRRRDARRVPTEFCRMCRAGLSARNRSGLCRECNGLFGSGENITVPKARRAVVASKPAPMMRPTPIKVVVPAPSSECPAHHRPPVALLSDAIGGVLYRCAVQHCGWSAWRGPAGWDVLVPALAAPTREA